MVGKFFLNGFDGDLREISHFVRLAVNQSSEMIAVAGLQMLNERTSHMIVVDT